MTDEQKAERAAKKEAEKLTRSMQNDRVSIPRNTITIGCKLPQGIVLKLDDYPETVTLKGRNADMKGGLGIRLLDYGVTEVEEEFWEKWKSQYSNFQPFKNKAIFEADEAEELANEKTGLEPLDPNSRGVESVKK